MVDEIHLLNDETRGATVEAVISRMKLVITHLHSNKHDMLRIVAVSATMSNFNDVSLSQQPLFKTLFGTMLKIRYYYYYQNMLLPFGVVIGMFRRAQLFVCRKNNYGNVLLYAFVAMWQ